MALIILGNLVGINARANSDLSSRMGMVWDIQNQSTFISINRLDGEKIQGLSFNEIIKDLPQDNDRKLLEILDRVLFRFAEKASALRCGVTFGFFHSLLNGKLQPSSNPLNGNWSPPAILPEGAEHKTALKFTHSYNENEDWFENDDNEEDVFSKYEIKYDPQIWNQLNVLDQAILIVESLFVLEHESMPFANIFSIRKVSALLLSDQFLSYSEDDFSSELSQLDMYSFFDFGPICRGEDLPHLVIEPNH